MILTDQIRDSFEAELKRAIAKFPDWPVDPVHAAAVVAEESGELVRECLLFSYESDNRATANVRLGKMETEAIQTAVVAIRFLIGIENYRQIQGYENK